MTTSVAMCTYNGERFIEEQLRSILRQTQPVDEIVICDDGSTDGTLGILQRIQAEYPDIIRLHANPHQMGVTANFQQAMSLCTGDIIFLSDQDDVWYPDKVDTLVQYLKAHPDIDLVFTNADIIDQRIQHNNNTYSKHDLFYYRFPHTYQQMFDAGLGFEMALSDTFVPGCAMAFRKSMLDTMIQHLNTLYHDSLLLFDATVRDTTGYINTKLFEYRLHDSQTSNHSLYYPQYYAHMYYHEMWPTKELADTLTNPILIQRVQYMAIRNQLLHKIIAPILIILNSQIYRTLYGNRQKAIMKFDIVRCFRYTQHRFVSHFHLNIKKHF